MRYFKDFLNEIFTWKWVLFFVLTFIFGWSHRRHLMESSTFIQAGLNQWDILIAISGDPIMLLNLTLPFMLLLSCLKIREAWNMTNLIRMKSWWRWVHYSVTRFFPVTATAIMLILVISFLLTAGLRYEANWSSFSRASISTFNYMSSLSWQSGLSPYLVIFLQMCLLFLFLVTIHAFISSLYLYFTNLVFLGGLSFCILLYALVTFRYFPDVPKLITYNYMTFSSSYGVYAAVYPAYVILLSIILASTYIIPLLKKSW
ncbi:hypothetical protein FHR92_003782 [Fontibacillus solani]|uniref:Uncharacterized protein n=1 Tax=Fontibacillus solani TaxID=1572857 RepID=A0A7W3SW96_9BACL|nr:hypothetical protein [Fontibacillus solani]